MVYLLYIIREQKGKKMNWFTFTLMNLSYTSVEYSVEQSLKFHGKDRRRVSDMSLKLSIIEIRWFSS